MSIFTYGCEVSVNKSTTLNAHLRTNTYVRTYGHTHMTENGKKEAANWHWQTGGGVWSAEKRNEDEDGRRNKETIELTKTVFLHINFHLQFLQTHTHRIFLWFIAAPAPALSLSLSSFRVLFRTSHWMIHSFGLFLSKTFFGTFAALFYIQFATFFFPSLLLLVFQHFPPKQIHHEHPNRQIISAKEDWQHTQLL